METKCFNCEIIMLHETPTPRCPGCNKYCNEYGGLSSSDLQRLKLYLQYTSFGLASGLTHIGCVIDQYYEDLLEHALIVHASCARCSDCNWWFDTVDLDPENGRCDSCVNQYAM